jgi:hypothetical protein
MKVRFDGTMAKAVALLGGSVVMTPWEQVYTGLALPGRKRTRNDEPSADVKSVAGGERRGIGPFGEVSSAKENRIERNDPDGLRPRRGAEVRGGFEAAGS